MLSFWDMSPDPESSAPGAILWSNHSYIHSVWWAGCRYGPNPLPFSVSRSCPCHFFSALILWLLPCPCDFLWTRMILAHQHKQRLDRCLHNCFFSFLFFHSAIRTCLDRPAGCWPGQRADSGHPSHPRGDNHSQRSPRLLGKPSPGQLNSTASGTK